MALWGGWVLKNWQKKRTTRVQIEKDELKIGSVVKKSLLVKHLLGELVDLSGVGPALGIRGDALFDKVSQLLGVVVRGQRRVVAHLDLLAQGVQVHFIPVERRLESSQLVEEATFLEKKDYSIDQ